MMLIEKKRTRKSFILDWHWKENSFSFWVRSSSFFLYPFIRIENKMSISFFFFLSFVLKGEIWKDVLSLLISFSIHIFFFILYWIVMMISRTGLNSLIFITLIINILFLNGMLTHFLFIFSNIFTNNWIK